MPRLTAPELTKEIVARELGGGLRAWVLDARALLGDSSKEIEALEVWGDAARKEVWGLEGRLCEEETSHRKSRREREAGICARMEEAHELELRAGGDPWA